MKHRPLSWVSLVLAVLIALLMPSCTIGTSPASSAGSLRAWLDQPVTGYTLPLETFTLKAHARQDGGGVTQIRFLVNETELGSVPTDAGEELTDAALDWNPSAEGLYRILAVAINSGGQEARSEVALICISADPEGTCSEAFDEGTKPSALPVDESIKVAGAPNPISIGANCNPADRILTFEAFFADTAGIFEVYIEGDLVSATGERLAFTLPMSPEPTEGSYTGTLDMATLYDGILGGADGTLEYRLSLLNEDKEFFKTSTLQVIQVRYCSAPGAIEAVIKVMGTPELVFIGKCTPSGIDFVAEGDFDPAMIDRVDLGYVWFDNADRWIGTVGVENRAAMTPDGSGAYRLRLDVNTAPSEMRANGGTIKFRAIVVNTDNADVIFSEVSTNAIKPCGAPVVPPPPGITVTPPVQQATCATYTNKYDACKAAGCYYWSNGVCADYAEPAAPTCGTYNNKPAKCKELGCNYWSDGTCSESPEPAPPACSDFFKNADGCKNAGCYFWSDNSCNDYPEPAPACETFLKPDACAANGCYWDEKQGLCFPY